MDIPKSRLPVDRTTPFDEKPHSQDIEKRSPSKLLVTDVKKMLLNHKINPEKWTIEFVANEYNIEQSQVGM